MSKKYKTIYADPPWWESGGGKIKRGADKHYPLMKTKDICNLPIQELADDNCHLYMWVTNNFLADGLKVMEAWGFKYKTMITWLKGRSPIKEYIRLFIKKETLEPNDFITLYNAGYSLQAMMAYSHESEAVIRKYLGENIKTSYVNDDFEEDDIIDKYDKPGLGQYFRGITESCLFGVKGVLPYRTDPVTGKRLQGITGFVAPRTIHSRKPLEMRMMIEKVSYPPYVELFARENFEGWDHWGNELPNDVEFMS